MACKTCTCGHKFTKTPSVSEDGKHFFSGKTEDSIVILDIGIITARKRGLGQGNVFTPVCHSVHEGEEVCPGGGLCSGHLCLAQSVREGGLCPWGGSVQGGGGRSL